MSQDKGFLPERLATFQANDSTSALPLPKTYISLNQVNEKHGTYQSWTLYGKSMLTYSKKSKLIRSPNLWEFFTDIPWSCFSAATDENDIINAVEHGFEVSFSYRVAFIWNGRNGKYPQVMSLQICGLPKSSRDCAIEIVGVSWSTHPTFRHLLPSGIQSLLVNTWISYVMYRTTKNEIDETSRKLCQ